jgi:Gpi18-like mannosyltransferase
VILFAPTVVINSAYWGQADMLWVAPLVAAIYLLLLRRTLLALVLGGVAFAFKLQPIFLAPFLLLLLLKRVLRWRDVLVIPLVYVIMILPAAFAGRNVNWLLTIYRGQTDTFAYLTLNAPTVYQWLPASRSESAARSGTIWGLSVLALLVYVAYVYVHRITPTLLLGLATASALTTPFVLPRMHDRYFFAADVLSIVLAFYAPPLIPLALLIQLTSFFSYWPFLFERSMVSGPLVALFEFVAIVYLLAWIGIQLQQQGRVDPGTALFEE